MTSRKVRLDQYLFDQGLAESRSKAQALILGRHVKVNDTYVTKTGTPVLDTDRIVVQNLSRYVSRGGDKIESLFLLHPQLVSILMNRNFLDLGSSTGGFADFLLQNGAQRVVSIDVGYGQLHPKIRNNPRVEVIERCNIRYLKKSQVVAADEIFGFVMDLSFISARQVLENLKQEFGLLFGVILVKPQFELDQSRNDKGIVRAWYDRREAILAVAIEVLRLGWEIGAIAPSGLLGPKGNQEYFLVVGNSHHLFLCGLKNMITSIEVEQFLDLMASSTGKN